MPPGRPPKRPSDGVNSSLDNPSGTSSKTKLPRVERGPEDFSKAVQSKLQTYTRTGQACDRCKIRKIRCDAAAEGCSHCTQQHLECYVTDRVTGRTERRGYLQQLEREKNSLLTHIRDLEKLLKDKGVPIRPFQDTQPGYLPGPGRFDLSDSLDGGGGGGGGASGGGSSSSKDAGAASSQAFGSLRSASAGPSGPRQTTSPPMTAADSRAFGTYLGVAEDNTPFSGITGTQLSILGTTIDITSFDAPDMDGPPPGAPMSTPLYNKSLQSFYNSVAKVNPPMDAPLPSREDAFNYSEWFFVMVGGFVPVLHKPSYFKLLTRIYDDPDFKPTKTELVIVHMVFAIIYYQYGIRNGEKTEFRLHYNDLSNKHYHWCVDKMWDLASEVSLQSIQALILMATHCRCFPKPGPAWLITTLAWNRAIEMNLHRNSQKKDEPTNLENEMRKRAWWCLFMIVVIMYGRLGKPMPIRSEDMDVDYPLAIDDELLTDEGILEPRQATNCAWVISSGSFRLAFLFMEMYNKVYVVRSDARTHVEAVRTLEDKFRAYQRELPDELKVDGCKPSNYVMATYLEASHHEFLLCLRHPSRCTTNDPAFVAESYRICEEASKKILQMATELARLKSLDTTWYQLAVYVAAVFTLLAARWVRRAEVTPAELAALKEEMNMGLLVIDEVVKYIGPPGGAANSRVIHQIKSVVDRTVNSIEQDMVVQQQQQQSSSATSTSYYQPQHLPSRTIKHEEYGHPPSRQVIRPQRSATSTPIPAKDPMSSLHRGGSAGGAMGGGGGGAGGGGASYYNSPMTQMNTAYSQMGYPELASTAGVGPPAPPPSTTTTTTAGTGLSGGSYNMPTSQDPQQQQHHQYLYAASAASAAAAAQLGHNTPASSPQTATAPNPAALVGYGAPPPQQGPAPQQPHAPPQQQQHHPHHHPHHHSSHHHPHHQQQHHHPQQPTHGHPHHQQAGGGPTAAAAANPWMTAVPGSANPWNEWTNAIVDPASQDRYSANALLTLGGGPGQRGPGDAGGGEMGVGGHPGVPGAGQSGGQQWPMLLFHPNVSGA